MANGSQVRFLKFCWIGFFKNEFLVLFLEACSFVQFYPECEQFGIYRMRVYFQPVHIVYLQFWLSASLKRTFYCVLVILTLDPKNVLASKSCLEFITFYGSEFVILIGLGSHIV
ncbi:hypothetical protein VNO77_16884 [Canavalia gladiata]|uniref:Uncharacterized protein n=1 Tax=Canavalia gladiata TaxID=3824 RepID=A0AAN9LI67_CANGL